MLGTLVRTVGPSPRPVGTQMVFEAAGATGYFSGGCLEADVANHAEAVLESGDPRRLIYGKGSPWIDIRLLCGGSLEIQLERIGPDDAAVGLLLDLTARRKRVHWCSDGLTRRAHADHNRIALTLSDAGYALSYDPAWRVAVVGGDPIALAIASLSATSGFETTIIRPYGPIAKPPIQGVAYVREAAGSFIERMAPDPWTAVVTATHDDDTDDDAILAAFHADPAYVGVLGSARRIVPRRERLAAAGFSPTKIATLHVPIGAARCGKAPWEVAVSVVAEIMQTRADRETFTPIRVEQASHRECT